MCIWNPCQKLQLLNNTRISSSLLLKQLELTARLTFSGQIISILWEMQSHSKTLRGWYLWGSILESFIWSSLTFMTVSHFQAENVPTMGYATNNMWCQVEKIEWWDIGMSGKCYLKLLFGKLKNRLTKLSEITMVRCCLIHAVWLNGH